MERGYSKLLIKDVMLPDKGAHWLMTGLDIELMQFLAGKERTKLQWRYLLDSVGLKIEGLYKHEKSYETVIEAVVA